MTTAKDPIAEQAAAEAVAATDRPTSKHPWVYRAIVALAVLFLFLGTFGGIVSAFNSVAVSHQSNKLTTQNVQLKKEQACMVRLLQSFELEQRARVNISADDRSIIGNLVKRVSAAKGNKDVQKAFAIYAQQQKANDKRRANYPIPSVNPNVCFSISKPPTTDR